MVAAVPRRDWILCQITSNPLGDNRSIELTDDSFAEGSLFTVSYVRPGKLFTADQSLVTKVVGRLKPDMFNSLLDSIIDLLDQSRI